MSNLPNKQIQNLRKRHSRDCVYASSIVPIGDLFTLSAFNLGSCRLPELHSRQSRQNSLALMQDRAEISRTFAVF